MKESRSSEAQITFIRRRDNHLRKFYVIFQNWYNRLATPCQGSPC